MWVPLVNVNHLRRRAGEARRQSRGSGRPSARRSTGRPGTPARGSCCTNVDGASGSATVGHVVAVGADLREQVDRLRSAGPGWPCRSRRPRGCASAPTAGRRCSRPAWRRARGPWPRTSAKPVLRIPPGIERRRGLVDHRERRDRRQAGRPGGGDEQLADPAVGHADHPDLVVHGPRAGGRRSRSRRSRRGPGAARRSRRRRPSSRCRACSRRPRRSRGSCAIWLIELSAAGRVGVAVARVLDQRSGYGPLSGRRPAGGR